MGCSQNKEVFVFQENISPVTPGKGSASWRPIEYRISNNGCWVPTNRKPNGCGYHQVSRNHHIYRLHRYTYQTIYGSLADELILRHICDNREYCNPSHLIPGTHKENRADAIQRGRAAIGTRNGRSKLNNKKVKLIRLRFSQGENKSSLARSFRVDHKTIRRILDGITWRAVL